MRVNRIVLASFGSGLLGAMFGATLVVWLAHDEAPNAGEASPSAQEGAADLERRVAAVERTLAAGEPRVRTMPSAVLGAEAQADAPASASGDPLAAAAPVDSPVFEAAVLDIIERDKEGRDSQRSVARDEKRRQREQYWANELTMRLSLTPAQTDRLLTIQAQLASALEHERTATPEGEFVPREKRRADRQAIRRHAEDQLRAVLAPRQLAAYEQLDDKLKLYRAKDAD
jgi:hypothetical protein